jgi:hypothetical protein
MSAPRLPLISRRTVISTCVLVASMFLAAPQAFAQQGGRVPRSFEVVPITITSVTLENGQLFANGLLGTNPFRTPLTVGATPSGGPCPILNLQLGPIDLNLLGLRVQTSPICLEVTAIPGGGLLGDLLCGVANLLQGGMPIGAALDTLTAQQRVTVLNGLTSLLDQVFDRITSNGATLAATCQILHLELGPLDLNLLGLRVQLDDCNNGPVTVDITAIQGGGLLGDLLCGLSNILSGPRPNATAIQALLFQISQLLGGLLG